LLLEAGFSSENGVAHYVIEGEGNLYGLLTDQVNMIRCLIDCYQLTLDRKFLERADKIAQFTLSKLWSETGGFYDKPKETDDFGALKLLDKPLEENSVAAAGLLKLHYLTSRKKYFEAARKTLEVFVPSIQNYGIMGCIYGLAVELYIHPLQVHIVGSGKDYVTCQFLTESLKVYSPLKIVEVIDPNTSKERLKSLGYPVADGPLAYMCFEGSCNLIEDPEKLGKAVGRLGGENFGK
jgi:uncharacterized protein YyaL (SSP411 family)